MIIFLTEGPPMSTNGGRINFRPMGDRNHKFHFGLNSNIGGWNELHIAAKFTQESIAKLIKLTSY